MARGDGRFRRLERGDFVAAVERAGEPHGLTVRLEEKEGSHLGMIVGSIRHDHEAPFTITDDREVSKLVLRQLKKAAVFYASRNPCWIMLPDVIDEATRDA